ncbi:MAG: SCP2 sterol-binding domain-containing protein [Candidatus Baldrarchaeia archaeon]
MSAEKIMDAFKRIIDAINKNEKAKEFLKKWNEGYVGKIINFKIGDKAFHLIFTAEEARFEEGEYPAPDLMIITDPESWTAMATMKKKWSELLAEGKLMIIGNAHELATLTRLIMLTGIMPI